MPATSRLPVLCTAPHTLCPPFDSRQDARAFNQPLSFDTSSVTDMSNMFTVRSALARPPLRIQALACTRLVLLRRPTPSRLPASMPPAPCARLMTRQRAKAFNELLSFDTSSVTDMKQMFYVRSAPAPPPATHPSPLLHASAPRPRASLLACRPLPMPFLFDNTITIPTITIPPPPTPQGAQVFNQPLSFDTSSVTRMVEMFAVRSAQAPPPLLIQALACTLLALLRRPTPSRLPARMPPASHARLSTRQSAAAFNQPLSFDMMSSVTDMSNMFYVRSAPAPPPATHPGPLLHASAPSPRASLLACRPLPMPSFYSSGVSRLVRRKQVAHALRLVGAPGVRQYC